MHGTRRVYRKYKEAVGKGAIVAYMQLWNEAKRPFGVQFRMSTGDSFITRRIVFFLNPSFFMLTISAETYIM